MQAFVRLLLVTVSTLILTPHLHGFDLISFRSVPTNLTKAADLEERKGISEADFRVDVKNHAIDPDGPLLIVGVFFQIVNTTVSNGLGCDENGEVVLGPAYHSAHVEWIFIWSDSPAFTDTFGLRDSQALLGVNGGCVTFQSSAFFISVNDPMFTDVVDILEDNYDEAGGDGSGEGNVLDLPGGGRIGMGSFSGGWYDLDGDHVADSPDLKDRVLSGGLNTGVPGLPGFYSDEFPGALVLPGGSHFFHTCFDFCPNPTFIDKPGVRTPPDIVL